MLNTIRRAWTWFVEGLVEVLLLARDRARRVAPLRLEIGPEGAIVVDAAGTRLGRLVSGDAAAVFEPPLLGRRLAGAAIDVVVPDGWMQRRDLDPVALASRPFLDAFVRHQIERITPWRVGDTHYRILDRPLPEDPGRLAVAVAVVPKRLPAQVLAALEPLHPGALRLRTAGDAAGASAIPLGAARPRIAGALRTGLQRSLAGSALAVAALVGYLEWQAGMVRDDIEDQDRILVERRAVLARARRGGDPGGEAAARLLALRAGRSPSVAVIDAIAAALPDTAHLTALSIDGDHVAVSGISSDPSGLVPALETSGAFAAVAFGSATTPTEAGVGDRFSLEMRILPPRTDHAVPPAEHTAPATGAASAGGHAP